MNTNISNAVETTINMVNGNLEQAINLAKEKTPELIDQILTWGVVHSWAWIIISSIIIIPFIFGTWIHWVKNNKFDVDDPFHIIFGVVLFVGICITFIGDIISIVNICKIKFAPMLYLMDYFSNIINK